MNGTTAEAPGWRIISNWPVDPLGNRTVSRSRLTMRPLYRRSEETSVMRGWGEKWVGRRSNAARQWESGGLLPPDSAAPAPGYPRSGCYRWEKYTPRDDA